MPEQRGLRWLVWIGLALVLVLLDHWTKLVANTRLENGHPQELLPVLNFTLHAVDGMIKEGRASQEDFVFLSGVGCSSRLTSHYLNFDSGWTIHGRALAIATQTVAEVIAADQLAGCP